ncbi:MAG: hypothetical protein ACTSO9_21850 [Candidatus Helarchaeota archaeon]
MTNTLTRNQDGKKGKQELLNDIINDLMENIDSLLAVNIADWEGLSFASRLPLEVNDEVISATTLFTLEGAEATRKELESSLLGKKISYLIMMTEVEKNPTYMMVFPIENLGYIACVSNKREDMGIIIQDMKIASKKVKEILFGSPTTPKVEIDKKIETIQQMSGQKYENLLEKLKKLKNLME